MKTLGKKTEKIVIGNEGMIVTQSLTQVRGGLVLDTSKTPTLTEIVEGHVLVKNKTSGVHSALPVTAERVFDITGIADVTVIGVCTATILAEEAIFPCTTRGTVDESEAHISYPDALKKLLPHIIFE